MDLKEVGTGDRSGSGDRDMPPTRDLTRLFMDIIHKIAELSGNTAVKVIREKLVAVSVSDASFRRREVGLLCYLRDLSALAAPSPTC